MPTSDGACGSFPNLCPLMESPQGSWEALAGCGRLRRGRLYSSIHNVLGEALMVVLYFVASNGRHPPKFQQSTCPSKLSARTCTALSITGHRPPRFPLFLPSLGRSSFCSDSTPCIRDARKTLALSRLGHHSLGFYPITDPGTGNCLPWRPRLGYRSSISRPTLLFQGAQKDITSNELAASFYDHIPFSKTTLDRAVSQC